MSRHKFLASVCIGLLLIMWAQPSIVLGQADLLKELDKDTAPEKSKDPLQEIDTAPAKEPEKKDDLAAQLVKNISGSLRLRGMHYWQDAQAREGADLHHNFGEVLLKFSDWIGGKSWRADIAGWVEDGTQENTYAGVTDSFQESDRRRKYLEINEVFLTLSQKDSSVILGKKIFSNGLATLYSPADRLKPRDANDPLDQKELGIWQARVDYFLDQVTFTAAVLPVFQPSKQPSETSRWLGSKRENDKRDYNFYGDTSNADIAEDRAKINLNNTGYFGRAKGTYQGWDLFLSFYHGPNPFYVMREETKPDGNKVRIKETVKVGNYAAGFSTTYKKWEFHGEALYNYSYDGKDDNYVNYLGGATYTIDDLAKKIRLEQIDVTLEYAGEVITNKQDAANYVESSRRTRLGKNDIYARANFKYSEDFSFEYISNFELEKDESGRYQKFQTKYRLRDGLIWKVALEFFDGSDNSYYGRWHNNDRILTEFEYSF